MWNLRDNNDDDEWEVKAFEQDIRGNIMGTTWPPRSYTCAFCSREFKSAQALGGHMNVHRRDRARLQHGQRTHTSRLENTYIINSPSLSSSFPVNYNCVDGYCNLYHSSEQSPRGLFGTAIDMDVSGTLNDLSSKSSNIPSISPYDLSRNFTHPSLDFPVAPSEMLNLSMVQPVLNPAFGCCGNTNGFSANEILHTNGRLEAIFNKRKKNKEHAAVEELDLELRLGHKANTPE